MTKVAAHRGEVCGLKWSPDGRHLASGSNDNQIKIWTGVDRMRNPLHTLTDHIAAVKVCLFTVMLDCSVCLSICLFVCLFVCLPVCLFVCLSVCLFVCM